MGYGKLNYKQDGGYRSKKKIYQTLLEGNEKGVQHMLIKNVKEWGSGN